MQQELRSPFCGWEINKAKDVQTFKLSIFASLLQNSEICVDTHLPV